MKAGGTGFVSPGLASVGTPGIMKIKFTAQLVPVPANACGNGVTSPAATHVTGGTVVGSGTYTPLVATGRGEQVHEPAGTDKVGTITVTINWTTTGTDIAPTTVVYSGNTGTVTVSGGHDLITLTGGTISGSFTLPASASTYTTKLLTSLPGPTCGPGPYSNFKIHSGSVAM